MWAMHTVQCRSRRALLAGEHRWENWSFYPDSGWGSNLVPGEKLGEYSYSVSVRKLLIAATCLYQGKKKIRGSKSTGKWGFFLVFMLKWALTLSQCHEKSQSPRGVEVCDQIPYMHEMPTLSKRHKENDSRKSTLLQASEKKSQMQRVNVFLREHSQWHMGV